MKDFKERYDEFMKLPKKALAALLAINEIEENALVDEIFDKHVDTVDVPEQVIDWHPATNDRCTSWDKCGNPHMDCINCPLRGKTGGYTINGKGTFSTNTFRPGDERFSSIDQYQFTC